MTPPSHVLPAIAAVRSRRRVAMLTGLAVGLSALLGVAGYWYLGTRWISAGVAAWVDEQRARGYAVDHGVPVVVGFPLRWEVRVDRPSVVAPDDGWRWRAERIVAVASIWSPRDVSYDIAGRHDGELAMPAIRPYAIAHFGTAGGRLRIGADGRPAELTLDAAGIALDLRDLGTTEPQRASLGALTAHIVVAPAAPGPDPAPFAVTLEATDLDLPRMFDPPLGRRVNRIAVDGFLTGAIQPGPLAQALATWRAAGGVLQVKRTELGWGPLDLRAEATVTLDAGLRPLGAGTARIAGFADTIDRFVAARMMPRLAGTALKAVLSAQARVPAGGGAPVLDVPIEAQNGMLSIAGQRIMPLPALDLR